MRLLINFSLFVSAAVEFQAGEFCQGMQQAGRKLTNFIIYETIGLIFSVSSSLLWEEITSTKTCTLFQVCF